MRQSMHETDAQRVPVPPLTSLNHRAAAIAHRRTHSLPVAFANPCRRMRWFP